MKKIVFLFIPMLLLCKISTAQIIEDFETWNPYSIGLIGAVQMNEPAGWSCTDSFIVGFGKLIPSLNVYQSQLRKQSPGFSGNGAMRVISKQQGPIGVPGVISLPAKVYPALASNTTFSLDIANFNVGQSGGTPITFSPSALTLYVKNTVIGGDSTFITATILRPGSPIDTIIGAADTILSANINSWTQLNIPFNYILPNFTPNILRINISSGNPIALFDTSSLFTVNDGTEIIVDEIAVLNPTGTRQLLTSAPIAKVYPTNGSDFITVDLGSELPNATIALFNMQGQQLMQQELQTGINRYSLADLLPATYIYTIQSQNIIYQSGKLIR